MDGKNYEKIERRRFEKPLLTRKCSDTAILRQLWNPMDLRSYGGPATPRTAFYTIRVASMLSRFDCTRGSKVPESSETNLRRSVDECDRILAGKKRIDVFECARVDPNIPIEEVVKVLACLVKEGKIKGIHLSEVKADTIRRARAIPSHLGR